MWGEPEPDEGIAAPLPENPREAFTLRREDFLRREPPYPEGRFAGRGAVILGGGRYEASTYVTVKMLRACGWRHPILVWYRGHEETVSARLRNLPGVEVRDLTPLMAAANRRTFDGWPAKVFGLIESPFEECLFLDADCYPVRDPEFCFDLLRSGLMVWPNSSWGDGDLDFTAYDVPHDGATGLIGGQYIVRKRDAWPVLRLASWFDDHADYYYRHGIGDQDAMRAAIARLGFPVDRIPRTQETYRHLCYVDPGPDTGEPLFIHRQANKFAPPGTFEQGPAYAGVHLPRETEAWAYFFDWMRLDPWTGAIPVGSLPPGWLWAGEGQLLSELARGRLVLEIGRFCGLSTSYLTRTAATLDSIDLLDAEFAQRELDRLPWRDRCETRLLTGDGATAPDGRYDLVFIDADHSEESVRRDTETALARLAPGGLLAFHDYHSPDLHPGVRRAVDEFAARGWLKVAEIHSLAVFRPDADR